MFAGMFADSISNCGTISKWMTRNKNSLNFSMQNQFDFTEFITALVFRLFYLYSTVWQIYLC